MKIQNGKIYCNGKEYATIHEALAAVWPTKDG